MNIDSLRSHRVFGIALFDLVLAYAGIFVFHNYLVGPDDKPFHSTLQLFFAVIPFGVLIHMLFRQNTFLNRQIFDDTKLNGYKIFLIFCIVGMLVT